MSDREFKHDINKVIEGCAEALEKKMGFNPLQVIRHFYLFHMHFFENTPKVPEEELDDWYYLRDSGTHSAVIYKHETKEVRLVDPDNYWDEDTIAYFRQTEEEIEDYYKKYERKMKSIKRTELRELSKLIKTDKILLLNFIT